MSAPNKYGSAGPKALSTAPQNLKGENGKRFINNAAPQSPKAGIPFWTVIQCKTDCVFTTLTDLSNDGNSMDAITMVQGEILYGEFTTIQLASGSVIAYV